MDKRKRVLCCVWVFVFLFITLIQHTSIDVNARTVNYKNKSFSIWNLGSHTRVSIVAVSDKGGVQEAGWNHGGTIDYSLHEQGNGFYYLSVSMSNCNVTDWTPYLSIRTEREGYHPTGWTHGAWGGTGCNGSYEVHNLNDEWKDGTCLFYIGLGYGYNDVYANWTPISHTVAFDANGGENAPESFTKTYGAWGKIPSGTPYRDGYNFSGWSQNNDGYIDYYPNSDYGADQDGGTVTLYAQWNPISYNIKYNGNGANGGWMSDEKHAFGDGFHLANNGFTKSYKVSYNLNGGSCSTSYSLANGVFNGWIDRNDIALEGNGYTWWAFDGPYYANIYGDLFTYFGYNKYELVKHWKHYTLNGDENRRSSPIFNVEDYLSMHPDVNATYSGSKFYGWYHWEVAGYYEGRMGARANETFFDGISNTNGYVHELYPNQAWVANLSTTQDQDVTLYASWTNGSVVLPTPTRNGYKFVGWYSTNNQFIGNGGVTYTPSSDTTLVAHWDPIHYNISFDSNGGKGSMRNMYCTYGSSYNLTKNAFTKTGYVFTGWNTAANGRGKSYTDEKRVSNLTSTDGATITLYAQWRPIKYTIHFDANNGTGITNDMILEYDKSYILSPNGYSQENYKYMGWNTDKSKTYGANYYIQYSDQASVKNLTTKDGDVINMYAVWDQFQALDTPDRFFTLNDAQAGLITQDVLLESVVATDVEDGILENGTSVVVTNYSDTDFTQLAHDATISVSYRSTDSVGNVVESTATINISNPDEYRENNVSSTRFISEKYLNTLDPTSTWVTNFDKNTLLRNTLKIKRENQEIKKFDFFGYNISRTVQGSGTLSKDPLYIIELTKEDVDSSKEYTLSNGYGNQKNTDSLKGYFDLLVEE